MATSHNTLPIRCMVFVVQVRMAVRRHQEHEEGHQVDLQEGLKVGRHVGSGRR